MKKYIAILTLAVLCAAACTKEIVQPRNVGETIFLATSECPETRTVVQDNGTSVWWSAGDKIDVFCGPGNEPAVFTGQNEAPAATATFTGPVIGDLDSGMPAGSKYYFGIYPSSANSAVAADGSVTIELKSEQHAMAGTFEPDLFPAVARSEGKTLNFMNAAGGVKFSVGVDNVSAVIFEAANGQPLAGVAKVAFTDGKPVLQEIVTPSAAVTVLAPAGGFVKGDSYYAVMLPVSLDNGITITLKRDDAAPVVITSDKARQIKRGVFGRIGELSGPKSLTIETAWALFSTEAGAWNEGFGGKANSDRNIAMDDDYVYVAETPVESGVDSKKLWAISIADHKDVKLVNTDGVSGGAKSLGCPRVIKNTDSGINGGKDILVCTNLTRGGDPTLYMWDNGIDNAPKAVTLKTWTSDWYGDVFTVYGTLQEGYLFFDKTNGEGNGIVTFNLKGLPGEYLSLVKRIKFNEALGSHVGACAYYPFPGNPYAGVYSPGRGTEKRGQIASFTGELHTDANAAYLPTLSPMDYAEGRNGFILGYNFIEWKDKRYVIYGKQPDAKQGFVYVLEGALTDSWESIINTAEVKFRRDLMVTSGSLQSGSSGMDVTARVIGGDLYIAAQKQNVACGLYRLTYK